jgi:hypothetical protein
VLVDHADPIDDRVGRRREVNLAPKDAYAALIWLLLP